MNLNYAIPEVKTMHELLRSTPFELPYKGRIYGLIYFPDIYETIKKSIIYTKCDLNAAKLYDLPVRKEAKSAERHEKSCTSDDSNASFVKGSSFVIPKSLSKEESKKCTFSQNTATQNSKIWKDLKFDEIQMLSAKIRSKSMKNSDYAYLYEMYEKAGDQDALKLYGIIADAIKILNKNQE